MSRNYYYGPYNDSFQPPRRRGNRTANIHSSGHCTQSHLPNHLRSRVRNELPTRIICDDHGHIFPEVKKTLNLQPNWGPGGSVWDSSCYECGYFQPTPPKCKEPKKIPRFYPPTTIPCKDSTPSFTTEARPQIIYHFSQVPEAPVRTVPTQLQQKFPDEVRIDDYQKPPQLNETTRSRDSIDVKSDKDIPRKYSLSPAGSEIAESDENYPESGEGSEPEIEEPTKGPSLVSYSGSSISEISIQLEAEPSDEEDDHDDLRPPQDERVPGYLQHPKVELHGFQDPTGRSHNMPYLSKKRPKKKPYPFIFKIPAKDLGIPMIIIPKGEKVSYKQTPAVKSYLEQTVKEADDSYVPKQTSSISSNSAMALEEFHAAKAASPFSDLKGGYDEYVVYNVAFENENRKTIKNDDDHKDENLEVHTNPPAQDTRYKTPFKREPILDFSGTEFYFPVKEMLPTETVWQKIQRQQQDGPDFTTKDKAHVMFIQPTAWEGIEDEVTKKTHVPCVCCFDKRRHADRYERTRVANVGWVEPIKIPLLTRCKTAILSNWKKLKKRLTPRKKRKTPAYEDIKRWERRHPHGTGKYKNPAEFLDKYGFYRFKKHLGDVTPSTSSSSTEDEHDELELQRKLKAQATAKPRKINLGIDFADIYHLRRFPKSYIPVFHGVKLKPEPKIKTKYRSRSKKKLVKTDEN